MNATTLTPTELDTLVEGIAVRVYGPHRLWGQFDPDDGIGWLDPIYDWTEKMLANGVAPDPDALATAWQALIEQEAVTADR
jgi:hypothetical protein